MMGNKESPQISDYHKKSSSRPTFALFFPTAFLPTHMDMCMGASDAAREENVNLICCSGNSLHSPNAFDVQSNIIYDLVGQESVDGLAIWASGLGNFISPEETKDFCRSYQPLPVVVIGMTVDNIPCVLLDNDSGIFQAVRHLVDVHGRRRLAFIHGRADHPDDEDRYQAYLRALKACELDFDPALVTPHGTWRPETARRGIACLIDERKVAFDGIITPGDWLAWGATQELERRGIKVPWDVSIVGFNNAPASRAGLPLLTTVPSQFYERGYQAVKSLQLASDDVGDVSVPTTLVIRQSCGCQSSSALNVLSSNTRPGQQNLDEFLDTGREALMQGVSNAVGNFSGAEECACQFLEGFLAVMLEESKSDIFLAAIDRILHRTLASDCDVSVWQDGISAFRKHLAPYLSGEQLHLAEDLWHQARVIVSEVSLNIRDEGQVQLEIQTHHLRILSQELLTAFNIDELVNVLAKHLPKLGIPSCYLSMYEEPQKPTDLARLIMAYNESGRVLLTSDGLLYPSQQLVPPDLWPKGRQYSYIMEPLYFSEHQLGFVLFEIGPHDGALYEVLRAEISSALQGALLVKSVREQSAKLIRQHHILGAFMENIPDFVYFKDLEGRFTRVNRAHAVWMGVKAPAEIIGKSDFDFYTEEKAQFIYEQEQQIIQKGQPLLSLEEMDDRGRWILTTKMPLQDENGEIIGIFGLSRDISEIKRAQTVLEEAYAEVERQVEARTAELQREILERKRVERRLRDALGRFHALTSALPDLVYVFDGSGRCLDVVGTQKELLHYKDGHPLLGKNLREVLPEHVAEGFLSTIRQTVQTGSPQSFEYQIEASMGHRWFEGRTAPFLDSSDGDDAVVWLARDITERKQADAEAKKLILELEAKNFELERFTYTVSHDLKAPLVTIRGFLGFLEKDIASGDTTRLKKDIDRIGEAAGKMYRLLNELLELSRIGRVANLLSDVSFDEIVQDALAIVQGSLDKSGIQVDIAPDLPNVYGDRARLVEVVQNLLDNSCKFMGTQTKPLISLGCQSGENGAPIFFVHDNGIGIAPQYHEKVFGLFNKLDPQTDGTGVGLALVKRIIEVHGGEIWLESEVGKGTTFFFTLAGSSNASM